ncbi:Nn.00g000610.m01.CDS01 [Neocucurbitaria sp. VM-36]
MRFLNLATAATLLTLAQAFVIPSGTEDGVYGVSVREDGTEVHTKISERDPTSATPYNEVSAFEKRQNDRIWCGCGFNMNPGNCDAAVADLKKQMKPSLVKPKMSFYSIRGDVVAFACNRSPNRNWLLVESNYANALARITGACGRYIAGSTEFGDPNQALIVGYQRYTNGDRFCDSATSSPSYHC